MHNLVNKYLYNISKDLPKNIKDEVVNELKANIYDMLGEDLSTKNVEKVLYELGDPKLISLRYQNKERYLISPTKYQEYILSLKMTMIILSIIFFFFGAIIAHQSNSGQDLFLLTFKVLLGAISLGIIGIIISYTIVTFIYQLISFKEEQKTKTWSLDNLIEIPNEKSYLLSKNKILTNLAFNIILGIVGLFILIFYPNIKLFGLTFSFNTSVTTVYIPLFIVSIILLIIKSVLKLRMERINYLSTILDTVYSLFTGVLLMIFILNKKLYTDDFYNNINIDIYKTVIIVITSVIGLFIALSIAYKWYKTVKNY